jgi:hypothetical protein
LHAAIIDRRATHPHASKEILTTRSITVYNPGEAGPMRATGARDIWPPVQRRMDFRFRTTPASSRARRTWRSTVPRRPLERRSARAKRALEEGADRDQDDGAYLVFRHTGSGPWRAWDAGIPGNGNFTCAVTPPVSVLAAWNWAPGTCHPR